MNKKDYNHQYYLDHHPPKLKSIKPKILELDGKELERELERIIAENPKAKKCWTEKEDLIIKKLHGKIPNKKLAEAIDRSKGSMEQRIVELREKGFLSE